MKLQLKKEMDEENVDCDKAIISFQRDEERIKIEIEFSKATAAQLQKHFGLIGKKLLLDRAPEPNEICW